eukprot:3154741-Pyramimonas_sp.AAC.1
MPPSGTSRSQGEGICLHRAPIGVRERAYASIGHQSELRVSFSQGSEAANKGVKDFVPVHNSKEEMEYHTLQTFAEAAEAVKQMVSAPAAHAGR